MCMLQTDDLVYIDKQYKSDMEMYEGIKAQTHKIIQEHYPNTTLISEWKASIRQNLQQIKTQFTDWVNDITQKFYQKLANIETTGGMHQYADQDRFVTI